MQLLAKLLYILASITHLNACICSVLAWYNCKIQSLCCYLVLSTKVIILIKSQLYGKSCKNVKIVCKWWREFAVGHTRIQNKERNGRPSISDETVTKVEQTMHKNQWIALDDFYISVPEVSQSIIHWIWWKSCNIGRWVQDRCHECSPSPKPQIVMNWFFLQNSSTLCRWKGTTFIWLLWMTKSGCSNSHLKQTTIM